MSDEKFSVGGELDAKCGKCKAVRSHVIVALVEGLPKRVECLACRAVHNYRPPYTARVPKGLSTRSPRPKRATKESVVLSPEEAVDYSPKGRFKVGMVLRHKKLGIGMITRAERNKLTVVFGKDTHLLILTPPRG